MIRVRLEDLGGARGVVFEISIKTFENWGFCESFMRIGAT